MADKYVCPNCFQEFDKNILAMVRMRKHVPRLRFCEKCGGPFDFDDLTKGHLDESKVSGWWFALLALSAFFVCAAALRMPRWAAGLGTFLVIGVVSLCFQIVGQLRLKRYRLSDDEVQKPRAEDRASKAQAFG